MFLHSWSDVLRTLLVGSLAYMGLLLFVRISGKRTLASMNAFDFVVTVALGSTLATILLSSDVALAEGLAAFATLIGVQFAITWLSVHTDWVLRLVKSEPSLLAFRGEPLRDAMVAQRVTGRSCSRPYDARVTRAWSASTPWSWRPTAPSRW